MRITKDQYKTALKNGCGEMTIGNITYAIFGDYGLTVNYPKKTKDGILLLSKYVSDWKHKTLKQINNEIINQKWK